MTFSEKMSRDVGSFEAKLREVAPSTIVFHEAVLSAIPTIKHLNGNEGRNVAKLAIVQFALHGISRDR
jgi:hypothetical protein